MALGKEKESKLEQMARFMMANSKKAILKGKENIPMLQITQTRKKNILVNGHEAKKMDKVHSSIPMVPKSLEYGKVM